MARASRAQPEVRLSAPPSWWTSPEARRETVEQIGDILPALGTEEAVHAALDRIRDELVSTRQPLVPGQLGQLGRLDDIDTTTTVAPRDPMIWELRTVEDSAVLSCFGTEIAFPAATIGPLSAVLSSGPDGIVVADIGADLDDDEKLVLVRRLIREGLVRARW